MEEVLKNCQTEGQLDRDLASKTESLSADVQNQYKVERTKDAWAINIIKKKTGSWLCTVELDDQE